MISLQQTGNKLLDKQLKPHLYQSTIRIIGTILKFVKAAQ